MVLFLEELGESDLFPSAGLIALHIMQIML